MTKAQTPERKSFDVVTSLMAYEQGDLGDDEILELFHYLVQTGLAWQLQGHYGRMAKALMKTEWWI